MKDERSKGKAGKQKGGKAGRRKKWLTQRTRGPKKGGGRRGTWMGRMNRMKAGEGVARGESRDASGRQGGKGRRQKGRKRKGTSPGRAMARGEAGRQEVERHIGREGDGTRVVGVAVCGHGTAGAGGVPDELHGGGQRVSADAARWGRTVGEHCLDGMVQRDCAGVLCGAAGAAVVVSAAGLSGVRGRRWRGDGAVAIRPCRGGGGGPGRGRRLRCLSGR
jgi:hypothetical protein